jgi:mono/diheme cytochrome c family protein
VWRQQWTDTCYSGSITTAGGLVFVGRNDGRVTALDKTNGKRLWEFQTDGGANAPVSTFERNGKQYVVAYAGGTSLAGSKRSDGVWLFSLDGKLQSLPRGSAEPSARGQAAQAVTVPQDRVADVAHGRELYSQTCIACHGSDCTGGVHGAPLKTTQLSLAEIMTTVGNGRDQMPAFGVRTNPKTCTTSRPTSSKRSRSELELTLIIVHNVARALWAASRSSKLATARSEITTTRNSQPWHFAFAPNGRYSSLYRS